MPLEITVDTKRKKGVMKLSTLRKMDELQTIEEIPELSKPISILNLVKYSKQTYYNGVLTIINHLLLKSKVLF
jgi:hypothetical protein